MTLYWLIALGLLGLSLTISAAVMWRQDGIDEWRLIAIAGVPGVALLAATILDLAGVGA